MLITCETIIGENLINTLACKIELVKDELNGRRITYGYRSDRAPRKLESNSL